LNTLYLLFFRFKHSQQVGEPPTTALGEPANKLTMAVLRKEFKSGSLRLSNEKFSFHLLDEDSVTLHFCLIFPRSEPLNQIFFKKVDELISSGIVSHFEEQESIAGVQPARHRDQEAQPLTMDHLGVCFAIILICLGLSCVVFLIECLTKYFADYSN
jgi:hypothetical protein